MARVKTFHSVCRIIHFSQRYQEKSGKLVTFVYTSGHSMAPSWDESLSSIHHLRYRYKHYYYVYIWADKSFFCVIIPTFYKTRRLLVHQLTFLTLITWPKSAVVVTNSKCISIVKLVPFRNVWFFFNVAEFVVTLFLVEVTHFLINKCNTQLCTPVQPV